MLKNEKHFSGVFSKDKIPLIENNKSLIFNFQNSDQKGSHWVALSRKNNDIFVLDMLQLIYLKFTKIIILLQIYIEFKILIQIYVVCFVFYSVYTKLIQK